MRARGRGKSNSVPTGLILVPRHKDPKAETKVEPQNRPLVRLRVFPEWKSKFYESLPKIDGNFEQELPELCPTLAKVTHAWKRVANVYEDVQRREIEMIKKKIAEEPDEDYEAPEETINEISNVVRPSEKGKHGEHLVAGTSNYWTTYLTGQINLIAHSMTCSKDRIGDDKLLWKNIYPQDKSGRPKISPSGRYAIRIFVGSKWRGIIIDDRIPVDSNGVPIFPVPLGWLDSGEFWSLLLAKALCYVRTSDHFSSGYGFLHHLTSWITHEHLISRPPFSLPRPRTSEKRERSRVALGGSNRDLSRMRTGFPWEEALSTPGCLGAYLYEEPPFTAPKTEEYSKFQNGSVESPGSPGGEYSELSDEPASSLKMGKTPHPRCYLIRPFHKEKKSKHAHMGKGRDDLHYANLCPRLKRRRKRRIKNQKEKRRERKPVQLLIKTTSSEGGAWQRFRKYTLIFPRSSIKNQKEIVDVWSDTTRPFSNQPQHLLAAPPNRGTPLPVHISVDPMVPHEEKRDKDRKYVVSLHAIDWLTSKRETVFEDEFEGFRYLKFTLNPKTQYHLSIKNRCGSCIFVSASEPFEAIEWKTDPSYTWPAGETTTYSERSSYTSARKGQWACLFAIWVKIPEAVLPSTRTTRLATTRTPRGKTPRTPKTPKTSKTPKNSQKSTHLSPASLLGLSKEPFRISSCLHLSDSSLEPYIMLDWVNNDTMEKKRCLLLDAPPRNFSTNRLGYTLSASIRFPYDCVGGDWAINMYSICALADYKMKSLKNITRFSGDYNPNVSQTLLREVITSKQTQPASIRISLECKKTGKLADNLCFHAHLYDAKEAKTFNGNPKNPDPLLSISRIGECFFPSILVGEKDLLLECNLDLYKPYISPPEESKGNISLDELRWRVTIHSDADVGVKSDGSKRKFFDLTKKSWATEANRARDAEKARKRYLNRASDVKKGKPPKRITAAEKLWKSEEKRDEKVGSKTLDNEAKIKEREEREKLSRYHHITTQIWRVREVKSQAETCETKHTEFKMWVGESKDASGKHVKLSKTLQSRINPSAKARKSLELSILKWDTLAIEQAAKAYEDSDAPEWRKRLALETAKARVCEIYKDRFMKMLTLPSHQRNYPQILQHCQRILDKGEVPFTLERWIDHAVEGTVRWVLTCIDNAMGDEDTEEGKIDKVTVGRMLELYGRVEELRGTKAMEFLTQDDTDLIADARDLLTGGQTK